LFFGIPFKIPKVRRQCDLQMLRWVDWGEAERRREFRRKLTDLLPGRVLPNSDAPLTSSAKLFSSELNET
jgi:hypothetical protein